MRAPAWRLVRPALSVRQRCLRQFAAGALAWAVLAAPAWADAVQALRDFEREARSGRGVFSQTVTSTDGKRQKVSSGSFEFLRPNRFRFSYRKPFEQLIVADGTKVWLFDSDLNQASSRRLEQALAATPAALLAGGPIDKDFELSPLPARDGLDWALAQPRQKDAAIQSVRVGFRGKSLAAIEIVDSFGQRSALQFTELKTNVTLAPESFRFTPPPGADVVEQ